MGKMIKENMTQNDRMTSKAHFAEKLRLAGLRPTRQRVAIAALLLDGRHRHVTADSLTEEITAAGLHVSGGTVYNTLNQFTDAGLLRRVMVHNDYSLFDTIIITIFMKPKMISLSIFPMMMSFWRNCLLHLMGMKSRRLMW